MDLIFDLTPQSIFQYFEMCITSILLHVYEPIRNATGKLTAQKQKVVGIRNEKN